jgi:hypothetical protein
MPDSLAQFDNVEQALSTQLERLQEYRQTLITAAVVVGRSKGEDAPSYGPRRPVDGERRSWWLAVGRRGRRPYRASSFQGSQ